MVRNTAGPVNSQDLRALLNKDAVYNAVGLAAFDLYDEIDFDRWLVNGIEQVNLRNPMFLPLESQNTKLLMSKN